MMVNLKTILLVIAHPEDQNEEENQENLKKNERTYKKIKKDWWNVPIFPTRECEDGYGAIRDMETVSQNCSTIAITW